MVRHKNRHNHRLGDGYDDGDADDAATEALTASYLMDAEFDSDSDDAAEVESVASDSGFTATAIMGQSTLQQLLPAHRWGSIGTGLSLGASGSRRRTRGGADTGEVTPVVPDEVEQRGDEDSDDNSSSDGSFLSDEEDALEAMEDLVDMQQQMEELMLDGSVQSGGGGSQRVINGASQRVINGAADRKGPAAAFSAGGGDGNNDDGAGADNLGASGASSFADPPLADGVSTREQTLQRLRLQATRQLGPDFDTVYNYLLQARRKHVRSWGSERREMRWKG
jgi:hypothetical protein